MNANIRNSALALIALASLAIYILACTSFSPDDKKILYPSTEPDSGAVALAIYDRETGRSQVFFTPMIAQQTTTNDSDAVMFRAQWMPDGRRVLVAWACDSDAGKGLNFALLPYGTPGATKLFHVPTLDEPVFNLLYPPCLAGEPQLCDWPQSFTWKENGESRSR